MIIKSNFNKINFVILIFLELNNEFSKKNEKTSIYIIENSLTDRPKYIKLINDNLLAS